LAEFVFERFEMKLYYAAASPFVRKVMMVLHETDQLDDVEIVSTAGTAVKTGTLPLAQNPLGKIPALERTDGPAIYDSRVICRYLDARASGGTPSLYPEGNRLWDTLTIEATADGIMDAALLMVYEGRIRPEDLQYAPWIEAQWEKIDRAVNALNSRWLSHLAGPRHMGQIATACALGYCDFRLPDRNWRKGNEALADWFKDYATRPSFQATAPTV
jgi:glutathione S-transferase